MKISWLFIILLASPLNAKATEVNWNEFNDSVMLEITRPKNHPIGNTVCSAVLVAPKLVLTTAHCVSDAIQIKITFDVEKATSAKQILEMKPKSWVRHPLYDPKKTLYSDDRDHREAERGCGPDLPAFKKWIG